LRDTANDLKRFQIQNSRFKIQDSRFARKINLHLPGIRFQHAQTGPDPIFGLPALLARALAGRPGSGMWGSDPALNAHAGPSGPGATETGN